MNYKGICGKCRKHRECKTPCAFVDEILRHDNRPVFETIKGNAVEVRQRSQEIRESTFNVTATGELTSQDLIDAIFNADAPSPFRENQYKLERTQVFILHFMMNQSYERIAETFNTNAETVRGIYNNAEKRLLYALELLDKRLPVVDNAASYFKRAEKLTGALPKNQRHFLLAKLFGLTPKEIENFDGTNQRDIAKNIAYVADRLKAGEMLWLEPTEAETKEAQGRLERFRDKQKKATAKGRKARKAETVSQAA